MPAPRRVAGSYKPAARNIAIRRAQPTTSKPKLTAPAGLSVQGRAAWAVAQARKAGVHSFTSAPGKATIGPGIWARIAGKPGDVPTLATFRRVQTVAQADAIAAARSRGLPIPPAPASTPHGGHLGIHSTSPVTTSGGAHAGGSSSTGPAPKGTGTESPGGSAGGAGSGYFSNIGSHSWLAGLSTGNVLIAAGAIIALYVGYRAWRGRSRGRRKAA